MKKANAPKTEEKPALVEIGPDVVETIAPYLQFPVNRDARRKARDIRDREEQTKAFLNAIDGRKKDIAEYRQAVKENELYVAKLREIPDPAPFSVEEAQVELLKIARLPWVLSVKLDDPMLLVQTRQGMLKTRFDTRIVNCGSGVRREEFMPEPVIHEMPQYEIGFNLDHMGQNNWANNTNLLRIRLTNKKDVSKFIGGKVAMQEPHPHWASNGQGRFGNWEGLCLGEYEPDLAKASSEGVVPFLATLVQYLQTAGYEHAYRRKDNWALWLGKPEYNTFILRDIEPGESIEGIETQYKKDYKMLNNVEIPKDAVVNPGEGQWAAGHRVQTDTFVAGVGVAALYDGLMATTYNPQAFVRDAGEAGDEDAEHLIGCAGELCFHGCICHCHDD